MKKNFRYEGEYNSKKKQHTSEFIDFVIENKKYGDEITYSEAANILKYNIDDEDEFKKMKSLISRIKNILIEKGRVLKSISGIGWYILKPKHIPNHVFRTYICKSLDLINKGGRVLNYTDITQLSDIRKEEYDNIEKLNNIIKDSINKDIDESEYMDRMNYYNALKDD